jgi:hypothetical protein
VELRAARAVVRSENKTMGMMKRVSGNVLGRAGLLVAALGLVHCADAAEPSDSAKVEVEGKDQALYVLQTRVWQTRSIPVCWENADAGNAQGRTWVQQAVSNTWETSSNVRFTGWGSCSAGAAGIHIQIGEFWPQVTKFGSDLSGVTNGMLLNFTFLTWSPSCQSTPQFCIQAIAAHEFGHALGFRHEQARADTPSWCSGEGQEGDGINVGPWDLNSIMNYCNPAWNGNGSLSAGDIAGVRRFYGDGTSYGDDIALMGGSGWNTIPVATTNDDGTFNVTNEGVGAFGSWATTAGVQRLSGDFNGDGRLDFALTGPAGWATIPVAFAQTKGTWYVTNYGVSSFPSWANTPGARAITGDFNADGRTDIALTGPSGWNTVPVAYSNGNGTFNVINHPVGAFASWSSTAGVKTLVADFNGDGRADIALTGPAGWNTVPVASSTGGGFTVTNNYVGDFASWATTAKALAADFNNDGRADIALTGPAGWNTLPVATSLGGGSFSITNNYVGDFAAWSASAGARALVGDFNADGRADIALSGPSGWNTVPVATAVGTGSFSITNSYVGDFAAWSATPGAKALVGDFNADGRSDIALTGPSGWNTLPVAFSSGGGNFGVTNEVISLFYAWSGVAGVTAVVGDVD